MPKIIFSKRLTKTQKNPLLFQYINATLFLNAITHGRLEVLKCFEPHLDQSVQENIALLLSISAIKATTKSCELHSLALDTSNNEGLNIF